MKNFKKAEDKLEISDVDTAGNVVEPETEIELQMHLFTNTANDAPAESLLRLFYEGALKNTVGMMRAKVAGTDETQLLLVGVEDHGGGNIQVFPLASILDQTSVSKYLSPDGKGGWFEPDKTEAA